MAEPIEVLLIEDDPGDVALTREAMEVAKRDVNHRVEEDGEKTICHLGKQGTYACVQTPDLVILDLNLPRKDGRHIVCERRADLPRKSIPVVVLTTSGKEEDIGRTCALAAHDRVTKPAGLNQFAYVVQSVESFRLTIVNLPPKPGNAVEARRV